MNKFIFDGQPYQKDELELELKLSENTWEEKQDYIYQIANDLYWYGSIKELTFEEAMMVLQDWMNDNEIIKASINFNTNQVVQRCEATGVVGETVLITVTDIDDKSFDLFVNKTLLNQLKFNKN